MGWVDVALLSVLGLSVVVGVMRGFLSEVLALVGWLVAWFAARQVAPGLAPSMPGGGGVSLGLAYAVVFVGALLVCGIVAWLLRQVIRASVLSGADRVLGGVFGLARGVLIGLVVALLVGFTPLAREPAWQASQGASWLQVMLVGLRPMLPPEVHRYLPDSVWRQG